MSCCSYSIAIRCDLPSIEFSQSVSIESIPFQHSTAAFTVFKCPPNLVLQATGDCHEWFGCCEVRLKGMNEMNEKQIRLRSREEVQDFVQAASNCNFDIDISYDRVIIDAKSFLGVLGLGVSRVLTVTYCGKDMDFENTVQKYAVA